MTPSESAANTPDSREYISTAEAAKLLGRCVTTIRRSIKRHGLKAVRLNGGRYVVSRRALEAFLESQPQR